MRIFGIFSVLVVITASAQTTPARNEDISLRYISPGSCHLNVTNKPIFSARNVYNNKVRSPRDADEIVMLPPEMSLKLLDKLSNYIKDNSINQTDIGSIQLNELGYHDDNPNFREVRDLFETPVVYINGNTTFHLSDPDNKENNTAISGITISSIFDVDPKVTQFISKLLKAFSTLDSKQVIALSRLYNVNEFKMEPAEDLQQISQFLNIISEMDPEVSALFRRPKNIISDDPIISNSIEFTLADISQVSKDHMEKVTSVAEIIKEFNKDQAVEFLSSIGWINHSNQQMSFAKSKPTIEPYMRGNIPEADADRSVFVPSFSYFLTLRDNTLEKFPSAAMEFVTGENNGKISELRQEVSGDFRQSISYWGSIYYLLTGSYPTDITLGDLLGVPSWIFNTRPLIQLLLLVIRHPLMSYWEILQLYYQEQGTTVVDFAASLAASYVGGLASDVASDVASGYLSDWVSSILFPTTTPIVGISAESASRPTPISTVVSPAETKNNPGLSSSKSTRTTAFITFGSIPHTITSFLNN